MRLQSINDWLKTIVIIIIFLFILEVNFDILFALFSTITEIDIGLDFPGPISILSQTISEFGDFWNIIKEAIAGTSAEICFLLYIIILAIDVKGLLIISDNAKDSIKNAYISARNRAGISSFTVNFSNLFNNSQSNNDNGGDGGTIIAPPIGDDDMGGIH